MQAIEKRRPFLDLQATAPKDLVASKQHRACRYSWSWATVAWEKVIWMHLAGWCGFPGPPVTPGASNVGLGRSPSSHFGQEETVELPLRSRRSRYKTGRVPS